MKHSRLDTLCYRIRGLFRRKTHGRRRGRRLPVWSNLQQLEAKILLASVMDSGATLQIELQQGERVEVVSNGTNYELTSTTSTFTNAGVADSSDFSVFGSSVLTLNDLAQYTDVQISDVAADASVRFPDRGTGAFSHNFDITLNDAASPSSIMVNGAAHFGVHNLTVNTDGSILILSGSDLSVSDGNISLTAVNLTDADVAKRGVSIVDGKVTTTGAGDILLNGTGPTAAGMNGLDGVFVQSSSRIASTSTLANAGAIVINGNGGVGDKFGSGVYVEESTIVSSMGDISIVGVGGNGSGNSQYGVRLKTATIESTGVGINSAKVLLDGTAGDADSFLVGIGVFEGSVVRSVDGDITLIGRGGAGTGSNNNGLLADDFTLQSTGVGETAAKISVTGIGGGGTHRNEGARLEGDGSAIRSVDGAIFLNGDAGLASSDYGNDGLWVSTPVTSTGTAAIEINGSGGTANQFSHGVSIRNASTVVSSVSGAINVNGTGGNTSVGSSPGVKVELSATVVSEIGPITITGRGGNGGSQNSGVGVISGTVRSTGIGENAATISINGTGGSGDNWNTGAHISSGGVVTSVDGDIAIQGNGGEGVESNNRGVNLAGFENISSTGTGQHAANILISGIGGNGASYNHAVFTFKGDNFAGVISSVDGDIQITATSGDVLTANANTAFYSVAPINSTGDGNITLAGTATFGTLFNRGVQFTGPHTVSTNSGELSVRGIGGQGSGNQNEGVVVAQEAILQTATGLISIRGSSGANNSHGVELYGTADGGGIVQSMGSGSIEIYADGPSDDMKEDLKLYANAVVGGPNATGDLSIFADTIDLSENVAIQSSGNLVIAPITDGLESQTISLGFESAGGRTDLNLTDSELAAIQPGFASITIGTSGLADNRNAVTVDSIQLPSPVSIIGGTIADAARSDFDTPSTTLVGSIEAGLLQSTGSIVLATGSTLALRIAGEHPGDGFRRQNQVVADGRVDIRAGVELHVTTVSVWRPVANSQLTIVRRDGGTGTFADLPEGTALPEFLDATISYVGGDGDDIVLTFPANLPELPEYLNLNELSNGGITVFGSTVEGRVGQSVNQAGDVNGDGIGDFVIGASNANTSDNGRSKPGEAYLIYGNENPAHTIDLSNLGSDGVVFYGAGPAENTGSSVDAADFNNDGFTDVLIGAHLRSRAGARPSGGAAYIIWGGKSLPESIDLASPGSAGMTILGAENRDLAGNPVAAIGDVNNDGIQDIGLGAIWADGVNNSRDAAGETYVIFGGTDLPPSIDLSTATSGFMTIYGAQSGDESGISVSGLGDINGDNIDDFVIGARFADGQNDLVDRAGEAYILYGRETLPASIELATQADVVIYGVDANDFGAWTVGGGGDVNGDGFNDIIYGANGADSESNQRSNAGETYLIWGGNSLPSEIHTGSLGQAGITFLGADDGDASGRSVSIVGDLNADGFDDIAIGAYRGDGLTNQDVDSGEVVIILGSNSLEAIDLNNLNNADFILFGADSDDNAGIMVKGAGDVNGDGIDDLIVGAQDANSVDESRTKAGEAYLVYGNSLFAPATPLVTGPQGRLTNPTPTITWDQAADAVSYELWLERIGGEGNPIANPTVDSTSYKITSALPLGAYRSWVRANRADGSQSRWDTQTFGVLLQTEIHDVPFHSVGGQAPQISWDPVPGATGYRVFINNITQQTTVTNVTVTETSYLPTVDRQFGRHRVWVQPLAPGDFAGKWSDGEEFYFGPDLIENSVSTLISQPTFKWKAISKVDSVQIYIQKNGTLVVNETGITANSYTPQAALEDGDYTWWIRPSAANGTLGAWSLPGKLNVGGRTMVTGPDSTVSDGLATVIWEPVDGATWYEVYLLNDDTGVVQRESGLAETSYETLPLADGNYRAWVRSYRSDGSSSAWSRVHRFDVSSPAGDLNTESLRPVVTFDETPTFEWIAAAEATMFNLYLTDGATVIQESGITARDWTPASPLAKGSWSWWIQPVTADGTTGHWSSRGATDTFGRAVLSSDVAVVAGLVTFSWGPVSGADRYVLHVTDRVSGENVIRENNLTTQDFTTTDALTPGSYRAWVRAVSSNGVNGPWSLRVDFQIDD